MLCRHPAQGQKLDVAGLNEITVLIDRSETERTEVAINAWSPGLDGPPHAHDHKEQNFLVTAGRGDVVIGGDRFPAQPGDFFYVPATAVHQTINRNKDRTLDYFLFNAFLDAEKEGHASFADHIGKVRETRRQQAQTQNAAADPALAGRGAPARRGRKATLSTTQSSAAVPLVTRAETARCEAIAWNLPAGGRAALAPDAVKEQTLFVFAGGGAIQVGAERVRVQTGHTVFVPRGTAAAIEAGTTGIQVVSFGSLVA